MSLDELERDAMVQTFMKLNCPYQRRLQSSGLLKVTLWKNISLETQPTAKCGTYFALCVSSGRAYKHFRCWLERFI